MLGFLTFDCPPMADLTSSMQMECPTLRLLAPPVSLVSTMAHLLAGCGEWMYFIGYFGSLLMYLAVGY